MLCPRDMEITHLIFMPPQLDPALIMCQSTVLDRVGAQFMNRHRQRNGGLRPDDDFRPGEVHTLGIR